MSDSNSERRGTRLRRVAIWSGAAVFVAALTIGIITASDSRQDAGSVPAAPAPAAPDSETPPQIAANMREANQVIDASVQDRLAALEGVPVVVNQWASWCTPCREEFPIFQRLAERYRNQVAFLGLDSQDSRSDAEAFLEQFPVNYPSIFDPDARQAQEIGAGQAWPSTVFYDRDGEQTHVRQGGYVTEQQLDADIRRFALGG